MKNIPILLLLILCCLATQVPAQETEGNKEKSVDEVARELANPNNSLATLRFKNQYRWYKFQRYTD